VAEFTRASLSPGVRGLPARDEEQPGAFVARAGDSPEQVGRGLVRPLGVIEDEDQPAGMRGCEQSNHGVGHAVRTEARCDGADFGGGLDVDVGDVAQQGEPGLQAGVRASRPPLERLAHLGGPPALHAEQRADGVAKDPVGAARAVELCAERDHERGIEVRGGLAKQAGLAQAHGPDDRSYAPFPRTRPLDGPRERPELRVPGDQRQLSPPVLGARAELAPDRVEDLRGLLALEREGARRLGFEERAGVVEHGGVGVDRAGRGHAADARRGIGGVAHRRVGGAACRPHLGGEDVTPVDPELQRQREVRVCDQTQRPEHESLVVLAGPGDAGAQEELAAVAVDVDGEQGHTLVLQGLLHRAERRVERLGDDVGALVLQERIRAGEAGEGDAGWRAAAASAAGACRPRAAGRPRRAAPWRSPR
jgi:hypothetical protein